jgi:hypothetical protein
MDTGVEHQHGRQGQEGDRRDFEFHGAIVQKKGPVSRAREKQITLTAETAETAKKNRSARRSRRALR